MKSTSTSTAVERAAAILGSQKALAVAVGVSPQAVWAWINRGSVPPEYCAAIEVATKGVVTRSDLRPADFAVIWPDLTAIKRSNRAATAA